MAAAHDQLVVAAVLVAAGSGVRLEAGVPKAFVEVAGATLLAHALERFLAHPAVRDIVVVLPPGEPAEAAAPASAVVGGATRQESVAAGLAALAPDVGLVLVHDVARPFVPAAVIDAVLAALRDGADAAVPVVPIHDTVRRIDASGALTGTVDRSTLVAVQTPQGFRRDVLVAAHAGGHELAATDDAVLVEALGGTVIAVPGDEAAFKITGPADLVRAEAHVRALGSEPTVGGRPAS
jgi:2-C-methyl-D-erythritol 4-phosphate cytidylyltransferase